MSNVRIVHFGLDFLRFRCPLDDPMVSVFAVKLAALDSDNSSYGIVALGDHDFYANRTGDRYVLRPVHGGVDHPVMRFGHCGGGMAEFDIYSSFFSWDSDNFISFLAKLPHQVTRVDIACDFMGIKVREFVEQKIDTSLPFTKINERVDSVETIYVGDMKGKRKLVRVYDKKLDSLKKRKTEFFPSYFETDEPVTRYEIELRNQACRSHLIDLIKLLDIEYVYHLFYLESTTKFIDVDVPESLGSWYAKPLFSRGVPDPVLRFREAIKTAQKKGVDVLSEVNVWCGQLIS